MAADVQFRTCYARKVRRGGQPIHIIRTIRGKGTHAFIPAEKTLCGVTAARYFESFDPSQATCPRCKREASR